MASRTLKNLAEKDQPVLAKPKTRKTSNAKGRRYRALAKPSWFPSLTDALPLYIAQISLSMVWDPLVLRIGAVWLGFLFSMLNLGTLLACYWAFGKVNPLSKKFVKPCLTWVAYLTLITFDLMFL
ncbi:hypothetical protein POTOM_035352 [Populus tomentosa]|uniref:Uncharacterized protein n=1 Tax=Populus tomentosa TaxID=118781 RepID=A0A8X8CM13_POPTO|nr:hypothetical protein POTOM_035352 [Populus tomentosa]